MNYMNVNPKHDPNHRPTREISRQELEDLLRGETQEPPTIRMIRVVPSAEEEE